MACSDRGIERVSDQIREIKTLHSVRTGHAGGMDEDGNIQCCDLLEEGEKARVSKIFPPYVRCNVDAFQLQMDDGPLQLCDSGLRALKRNRGHTRELLRVSLNDRSNLFILLAGNIDGQISFQTIEELGR